MRRRRRSSQVEESDNRGGNAGDSLEGYRFLPEYLKVPGLEYLLVNAPDQYFTGFSWFDIFNDLRPGIQRSRALLFDLLGELQAHGWRSEDIGVFGFSQGCLMALDLACRYPQKFGCVVGVSGFVEFLEEYPEKFSPVAREQKIMATHGTLDSMLPYHKTRSQIQIRTFRHRKCLRWWCRPLR